MELGNDQDFITAVQRTVQAERPAMALMLGIKKFKIINRIYGYHFGSKILAAFGDLLGEELQGKGTVCRMDGTKFVLCVPGMSVVEAQLFFSRVRTRAVDSIRVDDKPVSLFLSGGAIPLDDEKMTAQHVISALFYTLDQAKREAGTELVFFDQLRAANRHSSLVLYEHIHQCVVNGCDGFYLRYQPLVRPEDGRVVGMEALLRWKQEPYGDLSPREFIDWLEQDDCFYILGLWILRQALTDGMEFIRNDPGFVVNVNLSYRQLERGGFQADLMDILKETGFPPKNLCLELTERSQPANLDALAEQLRFFRTQGIQIALDDFGTGTASLALLHKLPITCLKIDQSFIFNIQTNATDAVIVSSVINVAHELGMTTCMEGVETKELRQFVLRYPVTTHQGYYYSRPVTIDAFRTLVSAPVSG